MADKTPAGAGFGDGSGADKKDGKLLRLENRSGFSFSTGLLINRRE
jgi:hypothetical protein